MIPFKTYFVHFLRNLRQLYTFVGIFVQPLCIGHIIFGLYWAAHESDQFQVPAPKIQDKKLNKQQIRSSSVLLPRDVYLTKDQA